LIELPTFEITGSFVALPKYVEVKLFHTIREDDADVAASEACPADTFALARELPA
jgi:hypothetical protein